MMLVTTNIYGRRPFFQNDAYAHEGVLQIYRIQNHTPFFLYGFVIMPDHCHFLLKVPAPATIGKIMRLYKMGLAFQIGCGDGSHTRAIWQQRYYISLVTNPIGALQYIHQNPVKQKLVEIPEQYPWSSASGKWDVTPLEL